MKCCFTCKYFITGTGVSRYSANYAESLKPGCKSHSKNNRHIDVKADDCCDRYKPVKLKGLTV